MDGFCELVHKVLAKNQLPQASIYTRNRLELPGYFRPTKRWDMLVVHEGHLIAALEFKSQRGPSFGNNFNNRTEEALGSAVDLWTAYREGAFGRKPRPWLGWVMLLEESSESTAPVGVEEPHFPTFPEFHGSSYAKRYELLLRRLLLEKTYDSSCVASSDRKRRSKRHLQRTGFGPNNEEAFSRARRTRRNIRRESLKVSIQPIQKFKRYGH